MQSPSPASDHLFFLDTEFTQFRDGELLSLGLAGLDGREFYAEVYDYVVWHGASAFCHEVVRPQFGLVAGASVADLSELGERLTHFILELRAPVLLYYDYEQDWGFFEKALRAAPRGVDALRQVRSSPTVFESVSEASLSAQAAYFATLEEGPGPKRHHALADARALRAGWVAQFGAKA